MSIIEINRDACNKCGVCAAECPRRIITLPGGGFPEIAPETERRCNACGHCVAVCPRGCLSNRNSPLDKSPKIRADLIVTAEQVQQLLKSRRSVRAFKKKPVPHEMITRLIDIARYAPTGHNMQEVEWLVIDDRKVLSRIEELGVDWMHWVIKEMPKMAAESNMDEKLERQKLHHDAFLRGAPALIITHAREGGMVSLLGAIDSANALSYLDLAANSIGLGTCWAGYVYIMVNLFAPVRELLALPGGHVACGAILLGYNRFNYYRIPVRKEPRITWR